MKKIKNYSIWGILFVCSFLLEGCPPKTDFPNEASDTTPPEFLEVSVKLEVPGDPNLRGDFDIKSQDVTKVGLDSSLSIRITATAGDAESGITSITIESNLTWQCSSGHNSPIIGIVENAPLQFSTINVPPNPQNPLQINVVVHPITQTGCDVGTAGKGPVNFNGFVRVVALNGKKINPLKTSSKTFIFDYKNVGSL